MVNTFSQASLPADSEDVDSRLPMTTTEATPPCQETSALPVIEIGQQDREQVRRLCSKYDPHTRLDGLIGFGDYLSLLVRLHDVLALIEERGAISSLLLRHEWYHACCVGLCRALNLQGTPFDTVDAEHPYEARHIASGFRAQLREKHGTFQAVYYELALGGLLRQRADILRVGRSMGYSSGGPGSGIANPAVKARIHQVYFTLFDESLLQFSAQLLVLDVLLVDLLPIPVGPPVELARLQEAFGFPTQTASQWTEAFAIGA